MHKVTCPNLADPFSTNFMFKLFSCKIGSARNQHPYVSCLVCAKPGKIWPLKNPKSFFPGFFLQNFAYANIDIQSIYHYIWWNFFLKYARTHVWCRFIWPCYIISIVWSCFWKLRYNCRCVCIYIRLLTHVHKNGLTCFRILHCYFTIFFITPIVTNSHTKLSIKSREAINNIM